MNVKPILKVMGLLEVRSCKRTKTLDESEILVV